MKKEIEKEIVAHREPIEFDADESVDYKIDPKDIVHYTPAGSDFEGGDIDHLYPRRVAISEMEISGDLIDRVNAARIAGYLEAKGANGELKLEFEKLLSLAQMKSRRVEPEKIAELFGFLMSRKSREEYLGNFLADMKLDRAEKIAKARSPKEHRWIEFCFRVRLYKAIGFASFCSVGDVFKKLKPLIQWFIG